MPLPKPDTAILVINCGSSSVKFALIDPDSEKSFLHGIVEEIETPQARIRWDARHERQLPDATLEEALAAILGLLSSATTVVGVGHRVVHGGETFSGSALVTPSVIEEIAACAALAPLHNPSNLAGITAASNVFPDLPHVAVFDTAFHQTLPPHAYRYAVPQSWYDDLKVRRYGFHGTSHAFVAEKAAAQLGLSFQKSSLIVAHLGNGCSACAVEAGKSVDTTMGLSPLEGLVMGTRSGDVDPSLHQFLAENLDLTLSEITNALNRKSGLLGLSGQSNDMRTLVAAAKGGDTAARLAIEVFACRLAKAICGLTAALSKLDAIVFTGGIGENSPDARAATIRHLRVLGVVLDEAANQKNAEIITEAGSVPCLVIATNEELMIARETKPFTKL